MAKMHDRVRSLDSLRGLAALAVLVHHWCLAFAESTPPTAANASALTRGVGMLEKLLLRLLETGTADVMIFFVLSGFVLALSMEAEGETYGRFLAKRVFRIVPPLMVAVLLSAGLYLAIGPHPLVGPTPWLKTAGWTVRPDAGIVLGHWAMIDEPRFYSLDSVIWTLRHEIRISLVFPLIAWWVRTNPRISLLSSLIGSAIAAFLTRYASHTWHDWLITVNFSFLFFCGAWLAVYRSQVRRWMEKRGRAQRFAILGASLLLLVFSPSSLKGLYFVFAGAVGLVSLSFSDRRVVNALEHRSFLYLGRISYSLYLLHVPILFAVVHLLYGAFPVWAIIGIGVALTFAVSHLFHRFIERPSQRVGRLISARI